MSVAAFEAIVDDGQIRLRSPVQLPDKLQVYVLVPDYEQGTAHIESPRLANPRQIADFRKEMVEDSADAGV